MVEPGDVAPEILARLRPICRALPEVTEQLAWIGLRWVVRRKTFAHVYTVDPKRHLVYARTVATDEPVCVLTFRAPAEEMQALASGGFPLFRAPWGTNVIAMVLDDDTDWTEVGEFLTDSYCEQAPKKLAALVSR